MYRKSFIIGFVVLAIAGSQKCWAELHLKVDLALPRYNGGIWEETLKPGWSAWAQPRWHDMYGHDCSYNVGTGKEGFCGGDYGAPRPGIEGSGITTAMSTVYEGRGGLIASGLEICNLNASCDPPAVSGQVLYEPICNTWYMVTDFAGVPGANILLGIYGIPPGEYELISYHNKFGGERNNSSGDNHPHWECVCDPQPPMSAITVVPVIAADTFSEKYGSNYEWQKFKGTGDLGHLHGVEMLEGAYDVEIQQVTHDDELVPSVIRFRTDGSPLLVVYEGNCCIMVPDDIRPQRESQRAILNAFELKQSPSVPYASLPYPADGATEVPRDTVLNWLPGASGALHDLYVGMDQAAVENAVDPNAPPGRGRIDSTNFDSGDLGLDMTYYWRVDEINHGEPESPWKGSVWSFTTAACLAKEGFELYYDTDVLQAAWIQDGGAWIEISGIEYNSGERCMKLDYFNRSGYKYSEAGIEFEQPEDWTIGYDRVEVFFKGTASNDPENLYIVLEDEGGNEASVLYDGDISDVRVEEWQLFTAELAQFGDVDMTAVKRVFVGAGDRDATRSSGASGSVLFDDLKACGSYKPTGGCLCPGNLNTDTQIDLEDLQALAGILLDAGSPFIVSVQEGHCGDINADEQVDLEDLQAVAGILLDVGSPFIATCD